MGWAIRLTDVADDVTHPVLFVRLRNPWNGWWLHQYDPDANEGFGEATFGESVDGALIFDSFEQAKAVWSQPSTVLPERDGRPNCPLMCCSVWIGEVGT